MWARRGLLLAGVALVATLWLAATNQLILYIHPRYVVFTTIMAVIGLAFVIGGLVAPGHDHGDHDADHEANAAAAAPPRRGWRRTTTAAAAAAVVSIAVGMIVVPPATLSSQTAIQRAIGSSSAGSVGSSTASLASASGQSTASFAKFTVLDWSTLLRQTSDPAFYAKKPVDVVGFVTADTTDPENVFFVTRFVITCCAVDAQPVGIPVYLPGWKQRFAANAWVSIAGGFVQNPSRSSTQPIAVVPTAESHVARPQQPYLF